MPAQSRLMELEPKLAQAPVIVLPEPQAQAVVGVVSAAVLIQKQTVQAEALLVAKPVLVVMVPAVTEPDSAQPVVAAAVPAETLTVVRQAV